MNFEKRILILIETLFKSRKFKILLVLICILTFMVDSNKKLGYRGYGENEVEEICDKYVLDQKLYLNDFKKRIIYFWSSRYYKDLNRYIRGYIFPLPIQKKQYDSFKMLLSDIIEKTDGLSENTLLFRGEKDVDIESRFVVGEVNTFEGFISTSFHKAVGNKFSKSNNGNNFTIFIKAKKGTKGISINGKKLGKFPNQYEWLLNNGQKYITESVNLKNRIIIIKLL